MAAKNILLSFLNFLLIVSYTNLSSSAVASEVDPYLALHANLIDSSEVFNKHVNEIINIVLKQYNNGDQGGEGVPKTCQQMIFHIGLKFSQGMMKNTEDFVRENKNIEKFPPVTVSNLAYKNQSIFKRHLLFKLSRTIKMNNIYFGEDKLSHSLAFGFVYYVLYHRYYNYFKGVYPEAVAVKKATESAIDFGIKSERTILGRTSTGVFSFADLEANFQGFKFYMDLCGGVDSPLKKVAVNDDNKMQGHKWILSRPANLTLYVNPNWDELYNPNYYRIDLWRKVRPRIKKYCENNLVISSSRIDLYEKFSKSYNMLYIESLQKKNLVYQNAKAKLNNICRNSNKI